LLEWAVFYRLLGFDRIVIYSNDNTDGSDELLNAMQNHGMIEWRPRILKEGVSPQMSAYSALTDELFRDPLWHGSYLAWLDCDEFLILKKHENIKQLLAYYSNPDALFVNWKHFGSSGKVTYENKIAIDRFCQCSGSTFHNKLFKSISKINPGIYSLIENHRPVPKDRNDYGRIVYASENGVDVPPTSDVVFGLNPKKQITSPVFFEVAQLNHYAVRSVQEYEWKKNRGNGRLSLDSSRKQFQDGYFHQHDLNDDFDDFAVKKYSSRLREVLDILPFELVEIEKKMIHNIMQTNSGVSGNLVAKDKFHPDIVDAYILANKGRVSYGTFVGEKNNFLFTETPKAACSTLKRVLMELEGRDAPAFRQIGNESTKVMSIHARQVHGFKSLVDLDSSMRHKVLNSDEVIRFCVVRNPYARLVSAWADKIRQKEPGFDGIRAKINAYHHIDDKNHYPSFAQYVDWIASFQDISSCDAHWRKVSSLLMLDLIDYTHVLRTETLKQDLQPVLNIIKPGVLAEDVLDRNSTNESLLLNWRDLYTDDLAKVVHDLYREDFDKFNYSADSWMSSGDDRKSLENVDFWKKKYSELEQKALLAIRGRNEVIHDFINENNLRLKKGGVQKSLISKRDVFVLGDSHSRIFNSDLLKKKTPLINWKVHAVQGATLSGLSNPSSKTGAIQVFNDLIKKSSGRLMVFQLGEVDTGYVIWYRAERDGVDSSAAAAKALTNYKNLLLAARAHNDVIVVSAPLPTLEDGNQKGAVQRIRASLQCSKKQRTELTCWFNKEMENWCNAHQISYINLDSYSVGEDGCVSASLVHENQANHHYDEITYVKLIKAHVLSKVRSMLRK
jgi:hypothetical protein